MDSTGRVGSYSSIDIDSNLKVHISYFDNTNGDLKYATNISGSWVAAPVDSPGYVGKYTSIAIDSYNKVHISYYDATNGDLKYATNNLDIDGDGYTASSDCDDNDPLEHPNQTWYLDGDGDGYTNGTTNTTSCTRPSGYKALSELLDTDLDCNDANAALNPLTYWYPDVDEDGFGNPAISIF